MYTACKVRTSTDRGAECTCKGLAKAAQLQPRAGVLQSAARRINSAFCLTALDGQMKTTVLLTVGAGVATRSRMVLRVELWADGDALEAWWDVDPARSERSAIALLKMEILLVLDAIRAWTDAQGGGSSSTTPFVALDIASDEIALSLTFARKKYPPAFLEWEEEVDNRGGGDEDGTLRESRIAETVIIAAVAPGRGVAAGAAAAAAAAPAAR